MRLAVFGATGKTGRHVVRQALARDWGVKALSRSPEAEPEQPGVEVVGGDVLYPGPVYGTITGCDAVAVVLGRTKNNPPYLLSEGTRLITQVMQKLQVRRIVAVTALGVGDSREQVPLFYKLASLTLLKKLFEDKEKQEEILKQSDLDWTIVRPARLTDEPAGDRARVGTDASTVGGSVSREDVAAFVVAEVAESNFTRKSPYIT